MEQRGWGLVLVIGADGVDNAREWPIWCENQQGCKQAFAPPILPVMILW